MKDIIKSIQRSNPFKLSPIIYGVFYLGLIPIFSIIYRYFGVFKDHVGNISLGDAAYFSVVTITTLGYGDITPRDDYTKFFSALEAVSGVVLIGLFLGSIAENVKTKSQDNVRKFLTFQIHDAIEKPLQKIISNAFVKGEKTYVYHGNSMLIARNCKDINVYLHKEMELIDLYKVKKNGIESITHDYIDTLKKMNEKLGYIISYFHMQIDSELLEKIFLLENRGKNFIERTNNIREYVKIEEQVAQIECMLYPLKQSFKDLQAYLLKVADRAENREEHKKSNERENKEIEKILKRMNKLAGNSGNNSSNEE